MSRLAILLQDITPLFLGYWGRLAGWQKRLLLVAVGMLGAVFAWTLVPQPTQYTALFDSAALNSSQLNRVDAALAKSELQDYRIEGGIVKVPVDQRAEYLAVLDESDALPEALGEHTRREVGKVNPLESLEQRRRRLDDAHRREVAHVVRSLAGIQEAFVQVNAVTTNRFSKDKRYTAMLAVRMAPQHRLNPQLMRSMRNIVAASQPALATKDVTIVDLGAGRTYTGGKSALATTEAYLFAKQDYERVFAEKLRTHFAHVKGLRVAANVELQQTALADDGTPGPWLPIAVSASVTVPASYVEPADKREEKLAEIERSARDVLPRQRSESSIRVAVATYDDRAVAVRPASPRWWAMLKSPLGIGLSLCFLTLGIGLLRGIWQDTKRLREQSPVSAPTGHVQSTEPPHSVRVHERLTELVRDNPKVAADTITEWVRKAG